jgi:hypothetical protein
MGHRDLEVAAEERSLQLTRQRLRRRVEEKLNLVRKREIRAGDLELPENASVWTRALGTATNEVRDKHECQPERTSEMEEVLHAV